MFHKNSHCFDYSLSSSLIDSSYINKIVTILPDKLNDKHKSIQVKNLKRLNVYKEN